MRILVYLRLKGVKKKDAVQIGWVTRVYEVQPRQAINFARQKSNGTMT